MKDKAGSRAWGHLIKDLRVEQGVSQRMLARIAHVNRSTLRRLEDGEARGDIDVIERLLGSLGYELDAFVPGTVRQKEFPSPAIEGDAGKAALRTLLMPASLLGARP